MIKNYIGQNKKTNLLVKIDNKANFLITPIKMSIRNDTTNSVQNNIVDYSPDNIPSYKKYDKKIESKNFIKRNI
jgi:hypothetical protein